MIDWIRENEVLLWCLGAFSVVSVALAIFLTPWASSLMSSDYFMPERDRLIMLVNAGAPFRASLMFSDDHGATWTDPRPIHPGWPTDLRGCRSGL